MTALSEKNRVRLTVAILGILVLVLVGGFVHRMMKPLIFSQKQLANYGVTLFEKPRIFREPVLVDDNGASFPASRFSGKWTLVFFGFTYCPDICPTTMGVLTKFFNELDKKGEAANVQVIMVSVDPARDTPQKLAEYVHYFNPAFIGLTGEFMALQRFATDLNAGFTKVPGSGENYLIEHSGNIVIINPYGHYHGFFRPPFDPVRLRLAFTSVRNQFERDFSPPDAGP